ncbi:hypothetical protein E4191_10395 [Paracoccus liaowanqingii]|uniref:SGNH/GDSL hydrolase family protein n=1 Tax=Paracoccus liaowanqingii TaxID=2560053 RepID=A0A4P7HLG5_9RHOB|nr:hypothetical protein [Paracoccus liaowanqingii]QBX35068.1 hypothetical protein E4191_10395 [Paracoccus liaowanqingii]
MVVIGGSNSLLRDGWVDQLKQLHPDPAGVLNLSIGAATTAMGLFRLLGASDLPPGSVIFWEYSLNESNYLAHGQTAELLMHHTSWLFEICARRQIRVLPVLLYNRAEAAGDEESPYRALLADLLARRGLAALDAQALWKRDFAHLPVAQLYRDNPHYATDTGFPAALARAALTHAASARVPRPDPSTFAGKDLRIVAPQNVAPVPFANRILSCDMFPLRQDLHVPLTGRLLACFLISSPSGPAISFRAGRDSRGPYSTRISSRESGPPRQLKHLLLWSPQSPPLVATGDLVVTLHASVRGRPIVQHTMAWSRRDEDAEASSPAGPGGLIGVLTETDDQGGPPGLPS